MAGFIDADTLIKSAENKSQEGLGVFKKKGTRKLHENHVCMLFWLFILFWVLIADLGKNTYIYFDYTTASSFELFLRMDTDVKSFEDGYRNIHTWPDIYNYLYNYAFP